MNDKWVTFLLDIPISAAISGVASMIGTAIVQGTPVELALAAAYGGLILLLYPIMLALMYGGPIVMIANGLLKRRPGRIVGPLVMIGGLAAYAHGTSAESGWIESEGFPDSTGM